MPSQISQPLIKNRSFQGYDVIKQSGSYNSSTGVMKFTILKFNNAYDMMLFISMLFVAIRVEYTSCDTILLAEIVKSSEVKTGTDGKIEMELINYWL